MNEQETAALGRKATDAREILNLACDALHAELIKSMMSLPVGSEHVAAAHAAMQAVAKVRTAIEGFIANGKIATYSIETAKKEIE